MSIFGATFDRSNSTPIVKAIKAICEDALVLDYRRDADAFNALWALNDHNVPSTATGAELLKELADTNKTIILIDADELIELPSGKLSPVIPSDKFGKHLSALSWALCFTHRLWLDKKRAPELDNKPAPNIVILDMRGNAQHDATVTEYFDLPSSRKPSNIRWFKASLAGFDELVAHITATPVAGNGDFGDIATFAKRWKSALVEADSRSSHHELNNSMGPISLAACIADNSLSKQVIDVASEANEKRSRAAMLRAMQWVVKTEANSSPFKPIRLETERELRILLLDDQAEDGWLPVFSHYLGLEIIPNSQTAQASAKSGFRQYKTSSSQDMPQISLWYVTSPDSMLSLLGEKAEPAKQTVARLRFTDDIPSVSNGGFDELLLLDLRLFGGDEAEQANQEKGYLEKVVNALQMATGSKPDWADQIGKDGLRETPEYLQALTGLSQLISAVDFSYPIVVWSSTGQRKVMECLRDFRNIFTGLEKPRFDAYMSNADDLRISLNDACLWAEKQLRAMSLFHELMALKDSQLWEPPANHPYAEVYIEEDGKSTLINKEFKVGALIAFYKSENDAQKLHSQMGKRHFGGSKINYKDKVNSDSFPSMEKAKGEIVSAYTTLAFSGEGRLPKKLDFGQDGFLLDMEKEVITDPRASIADKLKVLLGSNDIQCMMVTSRLDTSMKPRDIDPRYLFLLNDALRVAFTLFLLEKKVRVFVATKRGEILSANNQKAKNIAREYFENWGVLSEVVDKQTLYSSLTNHSAFHAAMDAHSYSDEVAGTRQAELCGARGVTLSYKRSGPRPAHYEWQILNNYVRHIRQRSNPASPSEQALCCHGISSKPSNNLLSEYEVLHASFPHVQIKEQSNSWRHLHYYADEMLEDGAFEVYSKAGVVTTESWFDRSLSSVDPNKDSQLLILSCARSTLQDKLTDSIESYASAIFASPPQDAGGNLKLRNFVGKKLATKLASKPNEAKAAYEALLVVADARLASRTGKPKKQQKAERIFVQSVELTGFWVTFNPNSIGKVDKVSHPPSGWCPLNGQVALPAVGDEIKVVFDPVGLGYREGFCLVRQVQ